MTPEFSRPVAVDTIAEVARRVDIEADADERRRTAGRFRLIAIDRLRAQVTLQRRAGVIHAEGEVLADVTQACVVTNDPVAAAVRAPFHVRFAPAVAAGEDDDELELSADDCDTLPLDGGRIDLGELAAETLALALDPYPRSPAAESISRELEDTQSAETGPFAALAALRAKLSPDD